MNGKWSQNLQFCLRNCLKLPSGKKWMFGSVQTILLFVVGELVGGGSVAVPVGVWQKTGETGHMPHKTWHLTPETWQLTPDTWFFLFSLSFFFFLFSVLLLSHVQRYCASRMRDFFIVSRKVLVWGNAVKRFVSFIWHHNSNMLFNRNTISKHINQYVCLLFFQLHVTKRCEWFISYNTILVREVFNNIKNTTKKSKPSV